MRKPDFCICENKDSDQLRGNREADQRLCFRYTDSIIPLLPNITKVLGDPKGFGILVLKTEMRFYNSIYSSS